MNDYITIIINDKLNLTFKLFNINVIKDRLQKLKDENNLISDFYVLDKATKKDLRKKKYQDNARFFAYIKFFLNSNNNNNNNNNNKYGLVGGKTNYTSPDLDFSKDYGISEKKSFAKKFLCNNDLNWDETIIVVEHIPADNEKSDEEMALFIECYLQQEFNLFSS